MSKRSRELEAELARRSTERAEREQADADARASAALEAQRQAEADRRAMNDAIRGRRPAAEQAEPPPTRPVGSANGGEGEPENAVYEDGPHGRIRVWSEAELRSDNPKGT